MVDVIDNYDLSEMKRAGTFVPAPNHKSVYWLKLPAGIYPASSLELYLLDRIEQLEKRVAELEKDHATRGKSNI